MQGAVLLGPAIGIAADPAAARQRWLRGNSAEARAQLRGSSPRTPSTPSPPPSASADPRRRRRVRQGRRRRSRRAIKQHPDDADLLARRAELDVRRGRLDDALKTAEAAIANQDDQFLARWVRANIRCDRGDLDTADAEFRWFVRTYTARDNADKPIKDPDALLLVAQAGARTPAGTTSPTSSGSSSTRCSATPSRPTRTSGRPSTSPACCCWRSTTAARR